MIVLPFKSVTVKSGAATLEPSGIKACAGLLGALGEVVACADWATGMADWIMATTVTKPAAVQSTLFRLLTNQTRILVCIVFALLSDIHGCSRSTCDPHSGDWQGLRRID